MQKVVGSSPTILNSNIGAHKEEDIIVIKVIGIRYELNDETISVLGELKVQKQRLTKIILKRVIYVKIVINI